MVSGRRAYTPRLSHIHASFTLFFLALKLEQYLFAYGFFMLIDDAAHVYETKHPRRRRFVYTRIKTQVGRFILDFGFPDKIIVLPA